MKRLKICLALLVVVGSLQLAVKLRNGRASFAEFNSGKDFTLAVNMCPEFPSDRLQGARDTSTLYVFCNEVCIFSELGDRDCVQIRGGAFRGSAARRLSALFDGRSDHVLFVPRGYSAKSLPSWAKRNTTDAIIFDPVNEMYYIPPLDQQLYWWQSRIQERKIKHRLLLRKDSFEVTDVQYPKWLDDWLGDSLEEFRGGATNMGFRKSETLLLVVFTKREQVSFVNRLWKHSYESFFSSEGQHTLIVASNEIWDSGILEKMSWIKDSTVHTVPRVLSSDSPTELLEILGLAFCITIPVHFRNVVTVPFNRFPLRLWTEISAVSFEQEVYHPNKILPYKTKIRDQFSSEIVRAVILCEGRVCTSAVAKSIPRNILRSIFISSQDTTRITIQQMLEEFGNKADAQTFVGSFLNRVLSSDQILNRTLQVLGFGAESLSSDAAENLSTLFSGAMVSNEEVLPISAIERLEEDLHRWRVEWWRRSLKDRITAVEVHSWPFTSFFFEPTEVWTGHEECMRHYVESGNLGTHPARIFNRSLPVNGELEALKAKALAESALNRRNKSSFHGNIIIILLSKDSDLPLLEYGLLEYPKSPIFGAQVLLVPEKRSMRKPAWRSRLYKLAKTTKNIKIIPEDLMVEGSWGGASLVFKELVGYYFAFSKWPGLSHALFMSPDSIALQPQSVIRSGLCQKTSYFWSTNSSSILQGKSYRHHSLWWECRDAMVDLKAEEVPPFYRYSVKKGSQFKALFREHIVSVLLPQTKEGKAEFQKWWDFFKLTLVPDEHWIASLIWNFGVKGLIPKDLTVVNNFLFTRWTTGSHPEPFGSDLFDQVSKEPKDPEIDNYILGRKVPDLESYKVVLNLLSARWESLTPQKWEELHAKSFQCGEHYKPDPSLLVH